MIYDTASTYNSTKQTTGNWQVCVHDGTSDYSSINLQGYTTEPTVSSQVSSDSTSSGFGYISMYLPYVTDGL